MECIVKASQYKQVAINRGGRRLCRLSSDLRLLALLEPFKRFCVYLEPINNLLVFPNPYFLQPPALGEHYTFCLLKSNYNSFL